MRFRKNRKSISLDAVPELEMKGIHAVDGDPSSAVNQIDLQTAMKQLPSGVKRVFILHDIQGYHHRQIAQFFGYSVGNSKSQLHRARIRLRELLQGESASRN
jgi:RNA polymerase sigma-70 factor, ECF subfamily